MKLTEIVHMPRSEWEELIDEWIFSERDREIIKATMLDGHSYEHVAECYGLSPRQMARIVPKLQKELFKHIKQS